MDIPTFPAGTPAAKVNAAFDEAGCVVVTGLLEDDTRTAIRSDPVSYTHLTLPTICSV